ncbi:MAG: hypothetical protein K0R71_1286 [Bacillales bacterium]|jgi:hypothetical protein|nr:hypothetical protein [Bacillales bacterium]
MKKSWIIYGTIATVLALIAFVKPMQSIALDALSMFRVNDVRKIEITFADIQEGMLKYESLKENLKGKTFEDKSPFIMVSEPKHTTKKIKNAKDFEAFKLRLPLDLESEKPEITSINETNMKFKIDVEAANEYLKAIKNPILLSNDINNVDLTLKSPASAIVKYKELLFFATQKTYLDAPEQVKKDLRSAIIDSGFIPMNLKKQLSEIDVNGSDIFLPVLVGFGKEVDLGGKNGYIYKVSDLEALSKIAESVKGKSGTPIASEETHLFENENTKKFIEKYKESNFAAMKEAHMKATKDMPNMENASVLIWSKDGILYGLVGSKSDKELTNLARSVR